MPKVVVIHIITKLELGGAQQNTLYTVSHLDRGKFEPYLICGTGGVLDEEALQLGIPVYFVPELRREIHPIFDFLSFLKIVKLIRQIQSRHPGSPLLVHTHSSKAGIVGRVAAYAAGSSLIIHTYHGFGFHDYQNRFHQKFYIFLEKLIAKLTSRFIFVSRANANRALKLGLVKNPPFLIRSGISFKNFQNHRQEDSDIRKELHLAPKVPLVTMIACFKPQKNPLDFILMADQVLNKVPETQFLLVGDGELRGAIESEITRLKRNLSVKLLGWRRDIPEILASSDIFVLTSLWEGLPRVLIEARLSGLPVVTTDIEGADEIVDHDRTGFIVPKKDYLAIGEKVLYLLQNPLLAKKMGKETDPVPIEYDIDEMVRRQEKLYIELIEEENAG